MLRAKLEASSLTKHLKEGSPSLAAALGFCSFSSRLSFVLTHWNDIGRPAFDRTIQEGAIKQKYEVEKWVRPHLETMKTVTSQIAFLFIDFSF
ncbi:hypothetical protein CASFOL_031553 [Castilleja foliolosa]|uniref:Uncharacterized protein n=1 Tax=Castilleja foliolosa TaxID=1961234 RepID=A0ABD3C504_9LAMI